MRDEKKTKKQLISELMELRQRFDKMKASEAEHMGREKLLMQAEHEKQTILDSLVEHVVYHDMEMRVVWANRAACDSVGKNREELVGRHCYEIWAKRSDPCEDCPVQWARKIGQPKALEKTTPDGRTWYIQGSPVRASNGDILGMVELTLEITDLKRSEEALRKSEERYRKITEAITDYIFTVQVENGHPVETFHGPACEAVTGYTSEEFDSDPSLWIRMVLEEDRDGVRNQASRILSGEDPQPIEHRIVRKDGHIRWVSNTPVAYYDVQGNLISYDGLVQDITEHKNYEEALRESEERYRALVETIPHGVQEIDTSGIITFANSSHNKIFGYIKEQMIGKSILNLQVSDSARTKLSGYLARLVKEQPEPTAYIANNLTKDGRSINVQVDWNYKRDNQGRVMGFISVVTDITERMQAQKALQASHKELERRVEERTADLMRANQQLKLEIEERRRAEEALLESEERFRNFLDNLGDIAYETDSSGNVTYVNKIGEIITGVPLKDMIGKPFLPLIAEECQEVAIDVYRRTLNGENPEYELTFPNGKICQFKNQPLRDKEGNIIGVFGIARDITERRRAEEALRESEEKYRELFENESDAVMIFDAGTLQFEDANPATLDLYGYSKEEFLTLTVEDVSAEKDKTRIAVQRVKNGAPGSKHVSLRYFRKKDGAIFPGEICAGTFISGGRKKIIGAVRDITERKRAENALRESEETLKAILAASPVGIGLIRNRVLDWANKTMYRMVGYEKGSLFGESSKSLYPDAGEYERVGHEFYSDIKERGVGQVETRWVTKDGKGIHCYLQGSPLDQSDLSKGVIVAAMDITERKKAEKTLQKSERRYRLLAENVTDVIWTMDMNLRMTYESPSVKQLRGYTVEEAMSQTLEEILTPASLEVARKALAEELTRDDPEQKVPSKPLTLELELKCKDGSTVWTEVKASFLRNPEGKPIGILGVTRDISERKQAEEKLHIYQEQLRSLASELSLTEQRERRRLATDLHDSIGQVLAISKIKLDALRSTAPLSPVAGDLDEVRELIGEAIEQTRSLTFDLSPPVLYELGLSAAVEAFVEKIQKLHGIQVNFTDDSQPKPLSEDTRVLLFRAVQELLINSIKHGRANNARISTQRDGDRIRIEVEDDGIGFDVSEIDSHAKNADKFGFFSIRERLHHLGGRFEIFSKPGQGTHATLVASLKRGEVTC